MWEQFTTDFLTGIFIQKNTPPPPLQTRVAGSNNQKSPVSIRIYNSVLSIIFINIWDSK